MHNCAKYAGDRLEIDIETTVNKIFSHFSSSSKHTEEMKAVFSFVEEDFQAFLRHVPTRWLSIWPVVLRLHDSWCYDTRWSVKEKRGSNIKIGRNTHLRNIQHTR